MTLTMIDHVITEELDFEPGCDEEDCDGTATHKLIAVDPQECPCISLECTAHAQTAADYLDDWALWSCATCGWESDGHMHGKDIWRVVPL